MTGREHQPLRIRYHDSVATFPPAAAQIYRADPVVFNLELAALAAPAAPMTSPGLLLSVWDRDTVIGAAVRPLGHPLLTSGLSDAAAGYAAHILAANHTPIPGVFGLKSSAVTFAEQWCTDTAARPGIRHEETVYRLAALSVPAALPAGRARRATPADTELLVQWLMAYHSEAFGRPASQATTRVFLAQVWATRSQFLLWEADAPRSMARVHPACAGVVRLGPVFTPPAHRGHGAATAVTEAAIRTAHAQGASEIVLQADVTNTAANSIYSNLGFEPIATSVQIAFDQ